MSSLQQHSSPLAEWLIRLIHNGKPLPLLWFLYLTRPRSGRTPAETANDNTELRSKATPATIRRAANAAE
jgi:hypothetical protein